MQTPSPSALISVLTTELPLPIEWLPQSGAPQQLIILLHGWCSTAQAMAPLAQALRAQFPQAAILAPESPLLADGRRRVKQWYSVANLNAAVWQERVAGVLPVLQSWVRAQQQRLGVGAAATALAGFSQGGILSLALALRDDGICGRVLCFGGRFVTPPVAAPRNTTLHFFHGEDDKVIAAEHARTALTQLQALQGDATLDMAQGIGHELHPALINSALHRLTHHVPLRTWQAALGAAHNTANPVAQRG